MNIKVRKSGINDFEIIRNVEEKAFGHSKEAELSLSLLQDKTALPVLSLLALDGEKAVGHILFTRAYINNTDKKQILFHILAPLAVIPKYQNKGIGGMLISEGLKLLAKMNSAMVLVLGHMEYYPKHGFIPDAKKYGYVAPYLIPEKFAGAWMVQFLYPSGTIQKGNIICADSMNKPEYWRE